MAWDYAELSKLAKENGGPEKLVEALFESGIKAGKNKMYPLIGVALAGGILITVGIQKISQKQAISKEAADEVKREIIQGIKDYDASKIERSDANESNNRNSPDKESE